MKRLHLFLIKSFLGPFIATFFIAVFVLLMQFLWKYIDDLVGKGLEYNQIAELLFYASARFIPIALPIAMLLASVMVFGKLGEQYELVALKSAGISLYRLLQPLIIFVLIISYGSFLFSNYVMPIANLKNGSMIYDIQKKKPALNIKEGVFYKDIEGFSIKVNKKDRDGVTLRDIIIYDHTSDNGNNKVLTAKSGKMQLTNNDKFLELTLYNGHSYIDIPEKKIKKKKNPFRITNFKKNIIRFDLASFNIIQNSEKLYKGHYAMLNNKQLTYAIDSLQQKYSKTKLTYQNKILNKYKNKLQTDSISNNITLQTNSKRQYDIAISKVRSLESISKSNKNN
jgi:lipopolysaccharide export system permease protein